MNADSFDPEPILKILAKHGVDYVLVGGIGGVLHGAPMLTDDLDVVPALQVKNLDALAEALNELSARILSADAPGGSIPIAFTGKRLQKWIVDFQFLNLKTDYGQLDLLHRPAGTGGFQDLAANAEEIDLGDFEVRVASLEDIIRSKQAVGRDRDLEQLPTLRMVLEQQRTAIRPGQKVKVPWELDQLTGDVVEIRGAGPAAQADVRVELPDGSAEVLTFPLKLLTPHR